MSSISALNQFVSCSQDAFHADSPQQLLVAEDGQITHQPVGSNRSNAVQTQEKNRQTWNVFIRSLSDLIGSNQVDLICNRYSLDLSSMQRDGLPLLPEHVDVFSVGCSRILTTTLKQRFPDLHLKNLTTEQLSERLAQVNLFPVMGQSIDPKQLGGDPIQLSRAFFHDQLLMDKEVQILFSDVGELTFPQWMERFSKCILCRDLSEKQIIPVSRENGRLEYYKIYRKITTGDGLMAYGLVPLSSDSTLKPLLIFRSTQFALAHEDALESCLNDFERNVGHSGYVPAREMLGQLIQDPKFCPLGEKIEVAGYSLGGTHAQRFIAEHWRKVSLATFYNDPSVESELAESFAQEINREALSEEPPFQLRIYRVEGDFVDWVGDKHLGWGINRPDIVKLFRFIPNSNEGLHVRRIFDVDNPEGVLQEVGFNELSSHLDNQERGSMVVWCERLRKQFGQFICMLLIGLRALLNCFTAWFGISILRRSVVSESSH